MTVANQRFIARAQARAARQAKERLAAATTYVPPGVPVPESDAARSASTVASRPAPLGSQLPQKERTRFLHDDLAEVINRHGASPETVLMALELLRHQALAPRLRQIEME